MDSREEAVRLYANTELLYGNGRIVCPWCGGGSASERSLSVLINERGQISWRCFRASCGIGGGNRQIKDCSSIKPPRPFTHPTTECDAERVSFFLDKFSLATPSTWRYSATVDRVICPVLGPEGQRRGIIARSYSGASPKTDTYIEATNEPWAHWSRTAYCKAKPVVIVEDVVSAEKVSQCGALGVALVGAYLSEQVAYEVVQYQAGRPVVLALDADAFAVSLKFLQKYGGQFNPPMTVWRLNRDLKDEAPETIKELIESAL